MSSSAVQLSVPLSHLVSSKINPRKVKPSAGSHRSLVALIRAYGLLQPLIVRPIEGKAKHYEVVAGHRRLRALKEIHKDDGDPKIPCILQDVDAVTSDAISLGENFGREAMHPLDEAEAFANLADEEAKGVEAIAADFGVTDRYVRQRMQLSTLAGEIKKSYRAGEIDTGTAQAFASVPPDRQMQVWKELNGQPRHAEQVRQVIANGWIDATHAMFDANNLPPSAISRDLFSEKVLVERQAFMDAQIQSLAAERTRLIEEGWKDVVAGKYEDVEPQARSMDQPEREFDQETTEKLAKLEEKRQKLEAKFEEVSEGDRKSAAVIERKYEELQGQISELEQSAPLFISEGTKSVATMFLSLMPDGQVRREYRAPRRKRASSGNGPVKSDGSDAELRDGGKSSVPTCNDLSGAQLAATFTVQAICVRAALLENPAARKRILAMILHDRIRSEALSVRRDANSTTIQASKEGFNSPVFDRLQKDRGKFDPLADKPHYEDCEAYQRLAEMSASKLDALIDHLIVDCLQAHLARRTELVHRLAGELKLNIRTHWRPDATWLAGFQKIQLSSLIVQLMGQVHAPAPDAKKSQLVDQLAKLFSAAADGTLEDKQLAQRISGWLPANLTDV